MIYRWLTFAVAMFLSLQSQGHAGFTPTDADRSVDTVASASGERVVVTRAYSGERYARVSGVWSDNDRNWKHQAGWFGIIDDDNAIALDTSDGTLRYQRGAHVLKVRLRFLAFYDPTIDSVHILASASNGGWTRSNRNATRSGYFPGCTLRYKLTNNGVKEYLLVSESARAAMPTPASLGFDQFATRLVLASEVITDSLGLTFETDAGRADFINAIETRGAVIVGADSAVFQLTPSVAWVPAITGDTVSSPRLALQTRFVRRNGVKWLITGERHATILSFPPGAIVFDPTMTTIVIDDALMRSNATFEHTDYTGLETNQWGATVAETHLTHIDTGYATDDGATSQWSASSGTDLWEMVNEVGGPNDGDYIYTLLNGRTQDIIYTGIGISSGFHAWDTLFLHGRGTHTGVAPRMIIFSCDTTANGVDDFFVLDTADVNGNSNWSNFTFAIADSVRWSVFDTLKIRVFMLEAPQLFQQVRVSWLPLFIEHLHTDDVGDVRRSKIELPTYSNRSPQMPIMPDSTRLVSFFPAAQKGSAGSREVRMSMILRDDDDEIPGHPDWIHRSHPARSWYSPGAGVYGWEYDASRYDRYYAYTYDSISYADTNTWVSLLVPLRGDTNVWHGLIDHDNGVLLWSPDESSATSNRAFFSEDGDSIPYWELFTTIRPPLISWLSPLDGAQLNAFSPGLASIQVELDTIIADTNGVDQEPSYLVGIDSTLVYFKQESDSIWRFMATYLGLTLTDSAWTDSSVVDSVPVDSTGSVLVTIPILWPNVMGACSLRAIAYRTDGNGDTADIAVTVAASTTTEFDLDAATYIDASNPTTNYNDGGILSLSDDKRILFKASGVIAPVADKGEATARTHVLLALWEKGKDALAPFYLRASPTIQDWVPIEVSYDSASSGNPFDTLGGSMSSTLSDSSGFDGYSSTDSERVFIDVTDCWDGDSVVGEIIVLNADVIAVASFADLTVGGRQPKIVIVTETRPQYIRSGGTAAAWSHTGIIPAISSLDDVVVDDAVNMPGTPVAIFFYGSNFNASDAITISETNNGQFLGMAIGPGRAGEVGFPLDTQQVAFGTSFKDKNTGFYTNRMSRSGRWANCIWMNDQRSTGVLRMYLKSLDPHGFTLGVGAGTRVAPVYYEAFGGTELVAAAMGAVNNFSGTRTETGPGIQGDVLFLMSRSDQSATSLVQGDSFKYGLHFGAATDTAEQFLVGSMAPAGTMAENDLAYRYYSEDDVAYFVNNYGTVYDRYRFGAFTASGWRWHNTTGNNFSMEWAYCVIKGGNWEVGAFSAPMTIGNQTIATSFEPGGMLVFSSDTSDVTSADGVQHIRMTIGSASAASFQSSIWQAKQWKSPSTESVGAMAVSSQYVFQGFNQHEPFAARSQASFVSFNSGPDGFTWNWPTVEAAHATRIHYIVMGPVGAAPAPAGRRAKILEMNR